MPPGLPVSNPEEAFRELLAFTQDVTGWLIRDERIYTVEYMDSGTGQICHGWRPRTVRREQCSAFSTPTSLSWSAPPKTAD